LIEKCNNIGYVELFLGDFRV